MPQAGSPSLFYYGKLVEKMLGTALGTHCIRNMDIAIMNGMEYGVIIPLPIILSMLFILKKWLFILKIRENGKRYYNQHKNKPMHSIEQNTGG